MPAKRKIEPTDAESPVGSLLGRAEGGEIVASLKTKYPAAECSLEYTGEPWKLLVMGRLSAQCTDARRSGARGT